MPTFIKLHSIANESRLFSAAGQVFVPRRGRSSDKRFEQQLLANSNKQKMAVKQRKGVIIIIIKSLINSAALKYSDALCRHMSFSAAELVCLQVSCKSCRRQ